MLDSREPGRILYQLELPLLQFILGAGTAALGWRLSASLFWVETGDTAFR
jgi:hypothetical protein